MWYRRWVGVESLWRGESEGEKAQKSRQAKIKSGGAPGDAAASQSNRLAFGLVRCAGTATENREASEECKESGMESGRRFERFAAELFVLMYVYSC
jgi:hypothetical protein